MRTWWRIGLASFTSAAALAMVFALLGGQGWLDAGDKVASIISLFVGSAALVLTVAIARRPSPEDPTEGLAKLVDTQWHEEAAARGLLHPEPLRIRWATTHRPVASPVGELFPLAHGARVTRLFGDVTTVVTIWQKLPSKQLVLLGEPGSGKTSSAVIFVRQLLATRAPGEPVPVLLTMTDWNPALEHLDSWLVRRLEADYPQVAARDHARDTVRHLVVRRSVVPVLDGLDEMPSTSRPMAIAALTEAVGRDRPLVITCRTSEYQAAIAQSGRALGRAAVVELSRVTSGEAARYLAADQMDQRWSAITEELSANSDGPLATALSTPLMVHLTRTAYASTGTDPAELLGLGSAGEVETRLLNSYIPAVYGSRPPRPDRRVTERFSKEDAEDGLRYLAERLHEHQAHGVVPWSPILLPPSYLDDWTRPWRRSSLICLTFLFGYAAGTVFTIGFYTGMLCVFMLLWAQSINPAAWHLGSGPLRVRVRRRWLVETTCVAIVLFFCVQVDPYPAEPQWLDVTTLQEKAWPLAIFTATVAALLLLADREHFTVLLSPRAILRRDRLTVLSTLVPALLVGGGFVHLAVGRTFDFPLDLPTMTWGLLIALVSMLLSTSVWCRWQVVRLGCWGTRRLPWRLLSFFEDAHRRGVLRRVGTTYQFRHARLQEHLATTEA